FRILILNRVPFVFAEPRLDDLRRHETADDRQHERGDDVEVPVVDGCYGHILIYDRSRFRRNSGKERIRSGNEQVRRESGARSGETGGETRQRMASELVEYECAERRNEYDRGIRCQVTQ